MTGWKCKQHKFVSAVGVLYSYLLHIYPILTPTGDSFETVNLCSLKFACCSISDKYLTRETTWFCFQPQFVFSTILPLWHPYIHLHFISYHTDEWCSVSYYSGAYISRHIVPRWEGGRWHTLVNIRCVIYRTIVYIGDQLLPW